MPAIRWPLERNGYLNRRQRHHGKYRASTRRRLQRMRPPATPGTVAGSPAATARAA